MMSFLPNLANLSGMPDALSTTIPIWCAVLNLAIFPSNTPSETLFLPPYMSQSTHAQITSLLPSFVTSLLDLKIPLPTLTKPLRPFWVTQDTQLPEDSAVILEDFTPIICCTASRRVVGSEMDEGGYIQGAADDTENWAHGLTPTLFWANIETLLQTPEADLPDAIQTLVKHDKPSDTNAVRLTPHISVSPLSDIVDSTTCHISLTSQPTPKDTWQKSLSNMEIGLGKGKIASRNLRLALPDICTFASAYITKHPAAQILVSCESGKDLSVGTALALYCFLFKDDGTLRKETDKEFTKSLIKSRLAGFMTTYPAANPSRNTLQSVNSFLIDWHN